MIAIIYERANGPSIAHVSPSAMRAAVVERQLAAIQPSVEGEMPPMPVYEDVTVTPAETEADFIDRMTAQIVPNGARHFTLAPAAIPSAPPEVWQVDWTAKTVSVDGSKALAAARIAATSTINDGGGLARGKYITTTPGQDLVYDRKRREAKEIIDDPEPNATKYPFVAASLADASTATRDRFVDEATLILNKEQEWARIGAAIERVRLTALADIKAATSPEQINAIVTKLQWP